MSATPEASGTTTVVTDSIHFDTKGDADMVNITEQVIDCVTATGLRSGIVTVFVPGATGDAVTVRRADGLGSLLLELSTADGTLVASTKADPATGVATLSFVGLAAGDSACSSPPMALPPSPTRSRWLRSPDPSPTSRWKASPPPPSGWSAIRAAVSRWNSPISVARPPTASRSRPN